MKRSKVIFLVLAGIFFILMIWVGYDISSRTTFPGSKPQLQERLRGEDAKDNSQTSDSLENSTSDPK